MGHLIKLFYIELAITQLSLIGLLGSSVQSFMSGDRLFSLVLVGASFLIAKCPIAERNRQHRSLFFKDMDFLGVRLE